MADRGKEKKDLKEIIEDLKKVGVLDEQSLKTLKEINEEREKALGTSAERMKNAQESLDIQTKRLMQMGEEEEFLTKQLEFDKARLEMLDEEINKLLAKDDLSDKEEKRLTRLQKKRQESSDAIEHTNDLLKERNKLEEEYKKQVEEAGGLAKKLGESIGMAANYQGSLLGKMDSTLSSIASNEAAATKFKEQMKETFQWANAGASIFSKVVEATIFNARMYDQAATSFNAATGAAGDYNAAIEDASRGHSALGVGTQEAAAAMGALHANMSGFTNLSKSTAADLAAGSAALEKLGISATTTAKTMDNLMKHMGMSADAAMNQANEMAEFAKGIGVAPAKMAEEFAAATPLMVKYGEAGTEVFKSLAKTAKSTGVEMNALLGIAAQFDTFEGAATAAGKLNAILGGPLLNSVSLLTATEAERIDMMRQAVSQSGKSWESMNRFEKQTVMAAAGISDLDTASRMFGENSHEVAEEQANLNEMIEKSIAVTDKLKSIAMNFAVLVGPIVDTISGWASTVATFMDENKGWAQFLGIVALAIGSIVIGYKALLAAMAVSRAVTVATAAATGGLAAAQTALAGSSVPAAGGIKLTGEAARSAAPGLLAFGFAALMAGGGIYFAALGVAAIVEAFGKLNKEQIDGATTALLIFGGAIIALVVTLGMLAYTGLLPIVAVGLLAIGAAAMMMGAGMMLAGTGISMVIDSLTGMLKMMIDSAPELPAVALGLLSIAGAMGVLASAGLGFPLIIAAFGAMALGVGALAVALALIKTEDLAALGQLGQALSNMTVERSVAFRASMEGFESAIDAADGAGISVLVGAAEFIKLAGFLPGGDKTEKPVPVEIVKAGTTGGGTSPAGPTTVKLFLNEREFAKAVVNVMNDKMNLRTG
jgi:hypothetical protein